MLVTVAKILMIVGFLTYATHITAAIAMQVRPELKTTGFRTIWKHTKWPSLIYLALLPFAMIIVVGRFDILDALMWATGFVSWYTSRDAGDDDENPDDTREKITSIVRVRHRRLVVVPQGT